MTDTHLKQSTTFVTYMCMKSLQPNSESDGEREQTYMYIQVYIVYDRPTFKTKY